MRFGEEEEDFERCVLGSDFTEQNGVLPLLDAEAKLILERCTATRERDARPSKKQQIRADAYLKRMPSVKKTSADIEAVRTFWDQMQTRLFKHEIAALCNLGAETVDEARTYLPSLTSTVQRPVDDTELQQFLNVILTHSDVREDPEKEDLFAI